MGLAIAASHRGHPVESLATVPGHAMAIALQFSRPVCSSLLCPCQGPAQIQLTEYFICIILGLISFANLSSAASVSGCRGVMMAAVLCWSSGTRSSDAQRLLFAQALLPEDLRPVISLALVPWEEMERPPAAGGFLLLWLGPGSAAAPGAYCRMLPVGNAILSCFS